MKTITIKTCGECPYWNSDVISGGTHPNCKHPKAQVRHPYSRDREVVKDQNPDVIVFCPL